VPELVLRTTFLVGHPGESDDAFARLLQFVKDARFERLGAFTFSREEGTVSAMLPERVPVKVARQRRAQIMRAARAISKEQQQALVGRDLEVMVEGVSAESEYLLQGRWYGQAPDIDGVVYLTDGTANPGDIVRARVHKYADYDLAASIEEVVDPAPPAPPAPARLPVVAS